MSAPPTLDPGEAPRATSPRRLACLLLLPLLLGACARRSETVLTGHAVHARDLARLTIGASTPDDVQRVLGEPDERGPDGALTYRATAVRRSGRALGAFPVGVETQVVGQRSATFRFAGGVLTRICRARS